MIESLQIWQYYWWFRNPAIYPAEVGRFISVTRWLFVDRISEASTLSSTWSFRRQSLWTESIRCPVGRLAGVDLWKVMDLWGVLTANYVFQVRLHICNIRCLSSWPVESCITIDLSSMKTIKCHRRVWHRNGASRREKLWSRSYIVVAYLQGHSSYLKSWVGV